MILSALDASRDRHFVSDGEVFDETGVSPPCDAGNVVGFVVGAVDRDENIRDFAVKGSGAVDGRFADIAAQKNAVGIFSRNLVENFPHEHRQHESGFPVFQLIVTSELSQSANGRTLGKGRALNQSFRDGDRQNIRLSGKAHDAHEKLVKAFPVHFVREHRVAHDFTHNVDLVVFFRRVIHKNLRFCFSCMCIE